MNGRQSIAAGHSASQGGAPIRASRFFSPAACAGFSLIELIVVITVSVIIGYFVVRTFQPRDAIALQQAERLRDDLRHVQMLAMMWGQPLRVTTAAASYSVGCVTAGASPCNVNPVIDPATGRPYAVNLEPVLTIAGPGFTLDLDELGRPKNGAALIAANATYTINGASIARTVTVAPLTGFATAQ